MSRSSSHLIAMLMLVAGLKAATPVQEPTVRMSFTKAPLIEVLNVYQLLTERAVLVSKELRDKRLA